MTSSNSTTHLQFMADESSHNAALAHDVLTGLSQARKTLPCIWFYDHRGSVLFEDITRTPEYYPTRTETRLLQGLRAEVAEVVGPGAQLVELGSGSSTKTRLLLQAMPSLAAYIPVDISKTFLSQSVAALSAASFASRRSRVRRSTVASSSSRCLARSASRNPICASSSLKRS